MWVAHYAETHHPYRTDLISRLWRLLPGFILIGAINLVVRVLLGQSVAPIAGEPWWPAVISSVVILGYVALRWYVIAPLLSAVAGRRAVSALLVAGSVAAGIGRERCGSPRPRFYRISACSCSG
ncbi:MAG TPA: hypothetical protein VF695_06180 [Sphingomonas sp.]